MLEHWRAFYFVEPSRVLPAANSLLAKAIYFLSTFGHQSVIVFFVLSGFFISSSVLRSLERGWSWRDYAIDRGVRLYVVLIPGLVLGGFWDAVGIRFFNQSGLYSANLVGFGEGIPAEQLNWTTFFGNLFFLQTRFATVFGSNGPLWSLFNEFWYYVLFPLLIAIILTAKRKSASVIGYTGLALIATWIMGPAIPGFILWLAGGCVALTSARIGFSSTRTGLTVLYTVGMGVLTGACLVASRSGVAWIGSDIAVGLSFALWIHGIVQLRFSVSDAALQIAKAFAGFSFSLYVLHFPFLLLIRAKWLPTSRWQPDGVHLLWGAGIAAGALLYAYAISLVTEGKTSAVRSYVRRYFAASGATRAPGQP